MTIDEAIKICNTMIFAASLSNPQGTPLSMTKEELTEAMGMAIKALEEVQQYRQIGTVEECREAVEKQTAKKPTLIDYKKYANFVDNVDFLQDAYWCPNCKRVVRSGSFCRDCGQKLGWSDEE